MTQALAGCRRCRNGTTRRCCGANVGRALPRRCGWCTRPPRRRPASWWRHRRGGVWHTTSCWPTRSLRRWCAGGIRMRAGRAMTGDGALRREALARFGHAPTRSQAQTVAEIDADMAAPRRMLRLLQGDVGSGKTLVATAGDAARGGGRRAGRADGADRNPGAPACAHPECTGAGGGGGADRLGEGQGTQGGAGRFGGWLDRSWWWTHSLFQKTVEFRFRPGGDRTSSIVSVSISGCCSAARAR